MAYLKVKTLAIPLLLWWSLWAVNPTGPGETILRIYPDQESCEAAWRRIQPGVTDTVSPVSLLPPKAPVAYSGPSAIFLCSGRSNGGPSEHTRLSPRKGSARNRAWPVVD
jgi:hypothetical protein